MSGTHSLAPWSYDADQGCILAADGRPAGEPARGVGDPVAFLRDMERVQADRRLMAAAPELLVVVRQLMALDTLLRGEADYATNEDFEWVRELADRARAALAKAEGRL